VRALDDPDWIMSPSLLFRPARKDESRVIAGLFQICSGGVADYTWRTLDYPHDMDLLDIGEQRFQRENTPFSYQNCTIAELNGRLAGMAHAYVMPEPEGEDDEDPDPVLRPYGELEIPGSFYLSGMAFLPEFRGHGMGTALLDTLRERARTESLNGLSLLVFFENRDAVRLYERYGFKTIDRRPVTPHPMVHYGGEVILMAME